jgi:hypothetical protein
VESPSLILTDLHGFRLVGHVTDATKAPPQEIQDNDEVKILNLTYDEQYASDQQVVGFLLSSLSKEVLPQVATRAIAADAWNEIETLFSSHTKARTINTCLQFATTQKGHLWIAEYINKMKSLAEEMAAAYMPLEDDELIEYILGWSQLGL